MTTEQKMADAFAKYDEMARLRKREPMAVDKYQVVMLWQEFVEAAVEHAKGLQGESK